MRSTPSLISPSTMIRAPRIIGAVAAASAAGALLGFRGALGGPLGWRRAEPGSGRAEGGSGTGGAPPEGVPADGGTAGGVTPAAPAVGARAIRGLCIRGFPSDPWRRCRPDL